MNRASKATYGRVLTAAVVAAACLAAGNDLGGIGRHDRLRWVVLGLALGFLFFGVLAVRSAARQVAQLSRPRAGVAAASAVQLVCSILGYILVLLGVLQLLNINLGALLVGGAVTGVILGIAAQQTLDSFVAGLVLLFARPYVPGQRITVHSGAMGGPFVGTVTAAGLLYTTLMTANGAVQLPNSGLLSAAVGPAPETLNDLHSTAVTDTVATRSGH